MCTTKGRGKILEKCVEWELLINPTAPLPCGEADCITILSSGDEDPELFGVKVEGAVESYSGVQGEAEQPVDFGGGIGEDFDFDFQMGQEPEESAPPVLEPVAPVADAFEAPPVRQQAEQDVVIDGISLSVHSALGALKAACEKLGLSKSGSKQRCFDRLKGYVQKQQLSAEVEIAQHAAAAWLIRRVPVPTLLSALICATRDTVPTTSLREHQRLMARIRISSHVLSAIVHILGASLRFLSQTSLETACALQLANLCVSANCWATPKLS